MPVATTDLVLFASQNMPDSDAGVNGGGIDGVRVVDFTQLAANDDLEVVAGDPLDVTQNVTVEARLADGSLATETVTLTGVVPVAFSTLGVVERVLKMELSAGAGGTVTLRRRPGGATVRALEPGKRGFMMAFRKCASDPTVVKNYYTKVFWSNGHATLALLNAKVRQSADPDARIMHLLATAVDDAATSANRVTAPAAGVTQDPDTFDDTEKSVPGTNLAPQAAIGVWLRLQLPAGDPPHRTQYVSELAGESV